MDFLVLLLVLALVPAGAKRVFMMLWFKKKNSLGLLAREPIKVKAGLS